jgi:hypothetical protein
MRPASRSPTAPLPAAELKALSRRLTADLDGWQNRARGLLDSRKATVEALALRALADMDAREAELHTREGQVQVGGWPLRAWLQMGRHLPGAGPCTRRGRGAGADWLLCATALPSARRASCTRSARSCTASWTRPGGRLRRRWRHTPLR